MSMVWILAELVDVRHPDTLFHKKVMVRVFRRSHDETTWVPGKVVYLCDQGFAPQKARILFVSGNRRAVYEKKVLSGMQESYMAEIMYRCHRTVSELRSNSQTYCLQVNDPPNTTGEASPLPNLEIARRTGYTSTSDSDFSDSSDEQRISSNLIIDERIRQLANRFLPQQVVGNGSGAAPQPIANGAGAQPLANGAAPQPLANGAAPHPMANGVAPQPMANVPLPHPMANAAAPQLMANRAAPHPIANGAALQPIYNRYAAPQPMANRAARQLMFNGQAAPQPIIYNRHAASQPMIYNRQAAPQLIGNRHAAPQPMVNNAAPQPIFNRNPAPQQIFNRNPAPQQIFNRNPAPQPMVYQAPPHVIDNGAARQQHLPLYPPLFYGLGLPPVAPRLAIQPVQPVVNGPPQPPAANDPISPPIVNEPALPPVVNGPAAQPVVDPVPPPVDNPVPRQVVDDHVPPQVVDNPVPPQVVNNPGPLQVAADPVNVPPQVVDNPVPAQVVDDPVPPQVVDNPGPPQVVADPVPVPPQVVVDPVPPQVVAVNGPAGRLEVDDHPPNMVDDNVPQQVVADPVPPQVVVNPVSPPVVAVSDPQQQVNGPAARLEVDHPVPLPADHDLVPPNVVDDNVPPQVVDIPVPLLEVNGLAAQPEVADPVPPPIDDNPAVQPVVSRPASPSIGNCLASPPVDNGPQPIVDNPASQPIDTTGDSRNNKAGDYCTETFWKRLRKMQKIAKIIDTELKNYTQAKDDLTTSSEETDEETNAQENIGSIEQNQSNPQVNFNNVHSEEDDKSVVEIIEEVEGREEYNEQRRILKRKVSLSGLVANGSRSYLKRRRNSPNISFSSIRKKCHNLVEIGTGVAKVPGCIMTSIDWSSHSLATRQLLLSVFPRSVLAQYSLLGTQPSIYNMKRETKRVLNPMLVEDIVRTVASKCNVPKDLVRVRIKAICREEIRIFRQNERKMKHRRRHRQQSDDYLLSTSSSSSEELVVEEIYDD